jgi:hypothetical protein
LSDGFAGALASYKNRHIHREVAIEAVDAVEMIIAREPPTADPRRVARGGAAPAAAITVVFRKGADGIVIRQLAERFPDLKIQEAALEASTDTKVSNYRKHSGLHRDTAGPNIEIAQ